MSIFNESDTELQHQEPGGLCNPPFSFPESLVDDLDDVAGPDTPASGNDRPEQAKSSRLRLTLPAAFYIYRRGFQEFTRTDHTTLNAYISSELDIQRLDAIQPHLWLAGLARPARPLHQLVMLGRQIIVTEQTDRHMVWHASKVYVKPLPEFLLCHSVWEQHLCPKPELYRRGLGLLFSYVQLVRAKSDLRVAHANGLLADEITWEQWTRLSRAIHERVSTRSISFRYQYGELRLARLNWIYRFRGHVFRGYAPQESRGWLVGTLVYITIVLTAMQVGLGTNDLSSNLSFQRASYGFTVFSILGPVIIICAYWGGLVLVILWNVVFTLRYVRTMKTRRSMDVSWVDAVSSGRANTGNGHG